MTKKDHSSQSIDKINEVPSQPLEEKTSLVAEPSPMKAFSSKARNLKGKKLVFSPHVAAKVVNPRRPFTISAAKKNVFVEEGTPIYNQNQAS
jgi:hypothetical protein